MDKTLSKCIRTVLVVGLLSASGRLVLAVPMCPPLCPLPPDPAPPMPPINVPDPPFRPIAPTNPNPGGSGGKAASLAGARQAGAECKAGQVSGTLVQEGGKFVCNFTPSTLPVAAACHAKNKIGSVTVVDGKRYCKIAP